MSRYLPVVLLLVSAHFSFCPPIGTGTSQDTTVKALTPYYADFPGTGCTAHLTSWEKSAPAQAITASLAARTKRRDRQEKIFTAGHAAIISTPWHAGLTEEKTDSEITELSAADTTADITKSLTSESPHSSSRCTTPELLRQQ